MSTTISCSLMGGLGNQLFQIFSTLSYGIDNDYIVVFPAGLGRILKRLKRLRGIMCLLFVSI